MKNRRKIAFGLALAICVFFAAHIAHKSLTQTQVVGIVTDEAGLPLQATVDITSNAAVGRFSADGKAGPGRLITDRLGHFQVSLPRSLGEVSLRVAAKDFIPRNFAKVQLNRSRVTLGRLVVLPGYVINGRVLDEQRNAIPGVSVTLTGEDSTATSDSRFTSRPTATTSGLGTFQIRGVESGRYTIAVNRTGFVSQSVRNFDVSQRTSRSLEIQLSRGIFLTGRVVDAENRGISGATLVAWLDPAHPSQTSADHEGAFQVGPFLAGSSLEVRATAVGFNPARSDGVSVSSKDFTVVLDGVATLRGKLTAEDTQQPIRTFEVAFHRKAAVPLRTAPFPGTRAFASDDGRFEWRDVQSGVWTISIFARGYAPLTVPSVTLKPGLVSELTLTLQKGVDLAVRVVDAKSGRGVAGARVSYSSERRDPDAAPSPLHPPWVKADWDGRATLENLSIGNVIVNVEAEGFVNSSYVVPAGSESFVELKLSTGRRVAGVVLNHDGTPAETGSVQLRNPALNWGRMASLKKDGSFEFAALPGGRYVLEGATSGGRKTKPREVLLNEHEEVTDIILRFSVGSRVQGIVSGLLPGEREGVQVQLVGHDDFRASVNADTQGSFEFLAVPAGEAIVTATTTLDRSISKNILVRSAVDVGADLSFPKGSRIYGRVTRAGRPVRFAILAARPLDGQEVIADGETSQSGQYTIEGLPAGRYAVKTAGAPSATVLVAGDIRLDFEIPHLALSGIVVDAATGRPVIDAELNIRPALPGVVEPRINGKTDHQGKFILRGLELGGYELRTFRRGYDALLRDLRITESPSELTIKLVASDGVSLRALDAISGLPLQQVYLMESIPSGTGYFLDLHSDENGIVRIPPSLRGSHLVIWSLGYKAMHVAAWNGRPLELMLSPDAKMADVLPPADSRRALTQ